MTPAGDQPAAIEALSQGLVQGKKKQTLLGVTGSGKTFTIANVIQKSNLPTLVISHNKTLAAQLYQEFKELFPTTKFLILFLTMIIINPNLICLLPILISPKKWKLTI